MRGFGVPGLLLNVIFLCGWWHTIDVARQIDWPVETSPNHERWLLCDQGEETINHLFLSCVFPRDFWFKIFRLYYTDCTSFCWWAHTKERREGLTRRGFNSLVVLGDWTIWKMRNGCVFEGLSPTMATVFSHFCEERDLWLMAGVKGLLFLSASVGR